MIAIARQEGLNVEQNAAEILVEQVRHAITPCAALSVLASSDLSTAILVSSLQLLSNPSRGILFSHANPFI